MASPSDIVDWALADAEKLAVEQQEAHGRLMEVHRSLLSCLEKLSTQLDANPSQPSSRLAVVSQRQPNDHRGFSDEDPLPTNRSFVSSSNSPPLESKACEMFPIAPAEVLLEWDAAQPSQSALEADDGERTTSNVSPEHVESHITELASQVKAQRNVSSPSVKQMNDVSFDKEASALDSFLEALPKNRFTTIILFTHDWISGIQEPKRSGFLYRFVHNQKWESLCVGVIALNAVFSAFSSDYEITHLNENVTPAMKGMELALIGFYTLELGLKVMAHGLYLFCSEDWRWNVFDLILVLFSLYDVLISLVLTQSGTNISVMRLFRLLKLSKVLRLFRVVRFLTELRLMFSALQQSSLMLFWCLNMLALILFAVGLVLVQGMTNHLIENGEDLSQKEYDEIFLHFGGVGVAMISLYKATTGGEDWGMYYRIVEKTGILYAALFLFYTAFFTFTLFNILTGMVVENVVKAADRDEEARVLEYRRKQRRHHQDLTRLFTHLDKKGSGKITFEEFRVGMRSDKVQAFMEQLELDPKDSELFFVMLASVSEDGAVDTDAFVSGCMQLRGPAAGIDLQCLIFETRLVHQAVKAGFRSVREGSRKPRLTSTDLRDIRTDTVRSSQNGNLSIRQTMINEIGQGTSLEDIRT